MDLLWPFLLWILFESLIICLPCPIADLDFTLLEMNPFTIVDGTPYPLDMRGELDDTALFKNFQKCVFLVNIRGLVFEMKLVMTSCSFSHLILESNWVHYCLFQVGSCRVSFAFRQDNECGWGENSSHGWEGYLDTLVLPYWLVWFIEFRGHCHLSNCSFSRLHFTPVLTILGTLGCRLVRLWS